MLRYQSPVNGKFQPPTVFPPAHHPRASIFLVPLVFTREQSWTEKGQITFVTNPFDHRYLENYK